MCSCVMNSDCVPLFLPLLVMQTLSSDIKEWSALQTGSFLTVKSVHYNCCAFTTPRVAPNLNVEIEKTLAVETTKLWKSSQMWLLTPSWGGFETCRNRDMSQKCCVVETFSHLRISGRDDRGHVTGCVFALVGIKPRRSWRFLLRCGRHSNSQTH